MNAKGVVVTKIITIIVTGVALIAGIVQIADYWERRQRKTEQAAPAPSLSSPTPITSPPITTDTVLTNPPPRQKTVSPAAEWAVKRLRRSVTALKKRCAEGTAAVDEYRRLVAVGAPPEGDALERLNTAITRLYPAEREAAAALNGAIPHLREVADLDRFDACMGNYKATAAELQTFSQRMNQRIMQFQARIPYQSESDSARQLAQLAQDLFEGVGQRVAMLNECLEFGIVLAD